MAAAADPQHGHIDMEKEKELLSSVIGDIRCYSGSDPLRPWLRGIRRLEGALPPATLREKLPRFLQKCAQEFQDEPRYRDDPRYLRVWIQMMDYVKDAKPLLKKLERNRIGLKRAAFYMAYAIYYEKRRRFQDAEQMYRMGIQNLAEPIEELHKSHDQFIYRMELYQKKKDKEGMPSRVKPLPRCANQVDGQSRNYAELKSNPVQKLGSSSSSSSCRYPPLGHAKDGVLSRGTSGDNKNLSRCNSDDTVVVRFVGSALVGKSETEDACHHGLVEPTINLKEAMDDINSMFLEPVEPETMLKKRSKRDRPKFNQQASALHIFVDEEQLDSNDANILHGKNTKSVHPNFGQQTSAFEIFVDEDCPNGTNQNEGQNKKRNKENNQQTSGFEIFVDENEPKGNDQNDMCHKNTRCPPRPLRDSARQQGTGDFQKPFVGGFAILADDEDEQCANNYDGVRINSRSMHPHNKLTMLHSEQADKETRHVKGENPFIFGLREDTIVRRFVGSAVVDEPKVENACHHGLVDPTINLKEAMSDINNMFGKPLNFQDGKKLNRKTNAVSERKAAPVSGFSILADDDISKDPAAKDKPSNSCKFGSESGLFEPTITTRDVMSEINDMFGMSLDF
ncbi:probable inactive serine/threonine-protein kinase bub1 [Hordeum vulgare subsp. vulgare]|uniref:BUB1 N-terminal domain-containing protein n=1 Tax=Hordeum vulgare subsp. vulgare TaxID=112509 RepID=A0A8I6XQR0_HORVV|nr:probable inactive serine/threonine-protein kinase bub1 [Hordeum vulgare subsp. vulgare]